MALTMGAFVFAVRAFANSVGSVEWQKTRKFSLPAPWDQLTASWVATHHIPYKAIELTGPLTNSMANR